MTLMEKYLHHVLMMTYSRLSEDYDVGDRHTYFLVEFLLRVSENTIKYQQWVRYNNL